MYQTFGFLAVCLWGDVFVPSKYQLPAPWIKLPVMMAIRANQTTFVMLTGVPREPPSLLTIICLHIDQLDTDREENLG